ncbi:TraB/GumN family protein [Pseudobacteriovorax antillogorgiicola]|uniref:TraB family protein n=1 Tax=Pseudobacteriovorax antillogorgiicola TaxID=1513793 RepID=A0A1Y6CRC9_9BACT|nr:TraB/GumN family protein [Pseudobacteriovorax antillogorgiicola]TCS46180.1 hypothetical protein EDD56_12581 [Pseudobacteriovorax antillogorgiicola]SMF70037.1 hypothetical protein SAMN06296036_12581 [Pseudobacteriovorax antillogorgiicola]
MINTITLLLGFWLGLFSSSCATDTITPNVATPTSPPMGTPLLWEVRKPSYPKSYLFGTIHLGVHPDEVHPIVWQRLKRTKQVVLEADVLNADPSTIRNSVMLPRGKSMRKLIGNEDWQKLLKKVPHVPPSALDRMNAYGIINTLQAKAFKGQVSMDIEIHKLATESKKNLVFLETIDFQINLLKKLFTPQVLKEYLENDIQDQDTLKEFSDIYKQGDIEKLYQLVVNPPAKHMKMSPDKIKLLIDKRNRSWAAILDPLFRRDSTFVAVGAGHLSGKQGLLQLLKKRGFILSRYDPMQRRI